MAIAGRDPADPASADRQVPDLLERVEAGPRGLRIGVPRDWVWDQADPAIASVVREAIEAFASAGADVRELAWPQAADYARAASAVLAVEARAFHDGAFPGRAKEYGPLVAARLAATEVDASAYAASLRLLLEARAGGADASFAECDVLAMPTVPSRAWTIEEAKVVGRPSEWTRITRIFDLTGQPAVSLPCGRTDDGIPVGLQLAGRMWDEATVLRAARAYELIRGPFPAPPL
jgi:Asp-tRNA(Asn)/Glu-tRNA(Gln) amidotransferase A subunit family amidase